MKKSSLNAVILNRLLIVGLIIVSAIIGVGYYYLSKHLDDQALRTNHAKIDATLVEEDINQLKILSRYLDNNEDIVKRAAGVVADSQEYQYQNEVIKDLNTYAQRTGISLLGIDFSATKNVKSSSGNIKGLTKTSAVINIKGPASYENILRFIKSIEQNLTKMQVSSMTLNPAENTNEISNPSIVVEVYIK